MNNAKKVKVTKETKRFDKKCFQTWTLWQRKKINSEEENRSDGRKIQSGQIWSEERDQPVREEEPKWPNRKKKEESGRVKKDFAQIVEIGKNWMDGWTLVSGLHQYSPDGQRWKKRQKKG